jgi:hypothetical protein
MDPRTTLAAFDRYLADRGLALEAVVVGGAALNLLGVITRQTRDCDILHPMLPPAVVAAARAFAAEVTAAGGKLKEDWLNNGPSSLAPLLPAGWELRLQEAFRGQVLVLRSLPPTSSSRSCSRYATAGSTCRTASPWRRRRPSSPTPPPGSIHRTSTHTGRPT